jgi:hypothetical protein
MVENVVTLETIAAQMERMLDRMERCTAPRSGS